MARTDENSVYQKRLSVISEISAEDNYTVNLVLTSQRNSIASLLDIPIIKNHTGVTNDAVGCGRYMLMESEEISYLVPFSSYYGGVPDDIALDYILLSEVTDNDVLEYGVLSGNIDILEVNMLPENEIYIYSNANKMPVDTSDFIYIGFNTNYGSTKDRNVRKALRLLIDTAELRESAFNGHVKQAWGIYPQCLYPDAAVSAQPAADTQQVKLFMSAAGYYLSGGVYTGSDGKPLEIKIAVTKNKFMGNAAGEISEMLAEAGIQADVSVYSDSGLLRRLNNGNFDMYIGEADITPDFDFSFLLSSGGHSNYGGFYESATNTLIANFALFGVEDSEETAAQISEKIAEFVPIIPIGYRTDYVYINRAYGIGNVEVTEADPFYNVFQWTTR